MAAKTGISLEAALDSIALAFGFDADTLIEYAALDPHGGYHAAYDDGFPTGSIWRVEGQILYALVRALIDSLPANAAFYAVELGTHYGCSATHILQAIADSGKGGTLVCVDLNGAAGNMIPNHLLDYVEFVTGDMFDYLAKQATGVFDLILEDGSHGTDDVARVWTAAHSLLAPGGVIVGHDAEHWHAASNSGVGEAVREGIAHAGYYGLVAPVRTYLVQPSDCGLAVFRKQTANTLDYVPPEAKRKNDDLPTIAELITPPDLSAMTIAELKAYAQQRDISLTGLRTKGEIIAAIEAA